MPRTPRPHRLPPSPGRLPTAAAAPVLLPLAEKGARAIAEVANTPVIGWTEITSWDKKGKHHEMKRSAELRAWEIGVVGLGAFALLWLSGAFDSPDQRALRNTGLFPFGLGIPPFLGH